VVILLIDALNKLRLPLAFVTVAALGQQSTSPPSQVIIAAGSRNLYTLAGGIGPSRRTKPGTLDVEPVAQLTESGEWRPLTCVSGSGKGCEKFAHEYLSKRHSYTVISAEGMGATIHTAPVNLSECYGYNGAGTYSGGAILNSAIAASSPDLFDNANNLLPVTRSESPAIRKLLRPLIPKQLDGFDDLRIMHLQLEGQELLILQRAFADNKIDPKNFTGRSVFLIGRLAQGRFQVIQSKQLDEQDQQVLGTIRMKNGKEFLITTMSDSESQSFRIYGVVDGRVKLVFWGGGSSC